MTNRLPYRPAWASTAIDAEIVDPDLDAAHPSGRGGAGKYTKGWTATLPSDPPIKQPHEWNNFYKNKTTQAISQVLHAAFLWWNPDVSYKKGAAAIGSDDKLYLSSVANKGVDPVGGSPTWYENDASADFVLEKEASMLAKINEHIPRTDNPHNDHITRIGGYTKNEIDKLIADGLQDLLDHEALTNNPHKVTYSQAGLVAKAGGTFTGQVDYRRATYRGFSVDASGVMGGGAVGFLGNSSGIGIGYDGEPAKIESTSAKQWLAHEGNYYEIENRHRHKFVLPVPFLVINGLDGLNTMTSGAYTLEFTRASTVTYTDKSGNSATAPANEPPITKGGILFDGGESLVTEQFRDVTLHILYADGVVEVTDVTLTSTNLKTYILNKVLTQFTIYPKLTNFQKSMLARS